MTNPTIPWELLQLDPDTDAPRLMQDFLALIEWAQFESVHTHPIQKFTFSLTTIAAGSTQDFSFTFSPAFNDVPVCTLGVQSASLPGNTARIKGEVYNLTATGGTVRWFNEAGTALGAGHIGTVVAFDSTFDTST